MKTTKQYSAVLMDNHYLVHAGINQYVWFSTYEEANQYLMSNWVDSRIATEVITPAR